MLAVLSKRTRLAIVLALAIPVHAEPGCEPSPLEPGWRLLSGASAPSLWGSGIGRPFPAKGWEVDGACLHLRDPRAGGTLFSTERYTDFELAFEWKIAPGGNSGVKYLAVDGRRHPDFHKLFAAPRHAKLFSFGLLFFAALILAWRRLWIFANTVTRRIGFGIAALAAVLSGMVIYELARGYGEVDVYPTGLEYQVTDDERNADAQSSATHRTGALYDILAPRDGQLRAGFNEGRIIVRGAHVEHWLNGRKVVEYDFSTPALRDALARSKFAALPDMAEKSAGRLELQNHGDEVWFRNVRIRPL
jgi:hypothetical protein